MQIKCSLVCRFYEVLMLKKMNVNFKNCDFSHDNWISKLIKKMSRIPAYCWLPGCSNINSILTWIFSQIILCSHCAFCTVTVHFAQWLCILHSDCALDMCHFFLFEVGPKVVPELPKTNSHWSLFCFLCVAWCMLVTFLWHLNLYSGAQLCSRVPIQISQWFSSVWKVSKAVFAVLTRHRLKWDNMVKNPNNP
jgi:hypothetical protein